MEATKKSLGSVIATLENLFQQFNMKFFNEELELEE